MKAEKKEAIPPVPENEAGAEEHVPEGATSAPSGTVDPLSPEGYGAVDRVQTVETERDDWKDKALRLAADMENLRRQTRTEVENARKGGMTGVAREFLEVQDNLHRALSELEKRSKKELEEEPFKSLYAGIVMVKEQVKKSCERMNIKKINALGEKFNAEHHQVMMEVDDDKAAPGTIVQELQAGYTIGERLLRPALVATAKQKPEGGNQKAKGEES